MLLIDSAAAEDAVRVDEGAYKVEVMNGLAGTGGGRSER
jgi:hypothetical protein